MPKGVYIRTEKTRQAIALARGTTGRPCSTGCTCRRHNLPPPSAESVQRRAAALKGHIVSEETRRKISAALAGRRFTYEQRRACTQRVYSPRTEEQRQKMSKLATALSFGHNFRGGAVGDEFWHLLRPAGFVREYVIQHGSSRGQGYHLDFAHVEGRINIELDGPAHLSTLEEDAIRDSWLKALGWRVIRIRH